MLQIKDVSKTYDNYGVFDKISAQIEPGNIVALIGKNGVGKTTLLKILAGIIAFDGDVILKSTSLKNNFKTYMKDVSYLPNTPYLYDYLTFAEMAHLILNDCKYPSNNQNLLNKLIKIFSLEPYLDTLCKNLSLGTRQKVAFVIGFFDMPKLILLDEPFVNFDNDSQLSAISFMENYVRENDTIIIYSTHDHSQSNHLKTVTTRSFELIDKNSIIIL